jgi:hypothetical protein
MFERIQQLAALRLFTRHGRAVNGQVADLFRREQSFGAKRGEDGRETKFFQLEKGACFFGL